MFKLCVANSHFVFVDNKGGEGARAAAGSGQAMEN